MDLVITSPNLAQEIGDIKTIKDGLSSDRFPLNFNVKLLDNCQCKNKVKRMKTDWSKFKELSEELFSEKLENEFSNDILNEFKKFSKVISIFKNKFD